MCKVIHTTKDKRICMSTNWSEGLNFVPTGIPMLIIISWSLAKYLHQDEGYVEKNIEKSGSEWVKVESWTLLSSVWSLGGIFCLYQPPLGNNKRLFIILYYVREAILNKHAWEHTVCCVCVLSDAGRQESMAGYGGYCDFQSSFLSQ